jgi:hypothetical protein
MGSLKIEQQAMDKTDCHSLQETRRGCCTSAPPYFGCAFAQPPLRAQCAAWWDVPGIDHLVQRQRMRGVAMVA